MADVRKAAPNKNAATNSAAETARKEAQLQWAMVELNREDAPVYVIGKGGALEPVKQPTMQRVIIVPVFKLDKKKGWIPSDEIIRQGNNKAFASLLLMSFPNGSGRERWQDRQWALASNANGNFLITALAPMPVEDAEKYEAGMMLAGRIDTAYTTTPTNPNNPDQDKWYISADARELDIPATDENGNVYYQKRYFEDDLSYPVQPQPKINRQKLLEEIMAAKA
jgi:hypothetical protein